VNGNNQWEWEGNWNKTRLNMGLGMGMEMNHWKRNVVGLRKKNTLSFTFIAYPHRQHRPYETEVATNCRWQHVFHHLVPTSFVDKVTLTFLLVFGNSYQNYNKTDVRFSITVCICVSKVHCIRSTLCLKKFPPLNFL